MGALSTTSGRLALAATALLGLLVYVVVWRITPSSVAITVCSVLPVDSAGAGARSSNFSTAAAAPNATLNDVARRDFADALARHLAAPFVGYTYRSGPIRRAYAVLMLENDRQQLCGARALMASLRYTGTTADVVALVAPDTRADTRAYLEALGYKLREVPVIQPNVMRDGYYASVFTSINLWALTEYDCVVKLDSDMVVLTNIDELFLYNVFAATPDYPAGLPFDSADCKETMVCQYTSHDFRARYLNGALLVVQPNLDTYNDMRGILERHEEQLVGGPSEQGFLNWYFKNKWFSLPHYYNVRMPAIRSFPQMFVVSPPRIFHYIGGAKPWKANFACNKSCQNQPTERWHFELWYKYYNDPVIPAVHPPDVVCQSQPLFS